MVLRLSAVLILVRIGEVITGYRIRLNPSRVVHSSQAKKHQAEFMRFSPLLRRSQFINNVLTLMTGTLIGQIITFGATLITGRLFNPTEFGDLTFFVAVTGIFIVISSLRYELAVMLPERDSEAFTLLILSLILCLVLAAITVVVFLLGKSWIASQFSSTQYDFIILMSFLFVFSFGAYQALTQWSIRRKHYRRLSLSQVSRAGTTAVFQVIAGVSSSDASGLIAGQVLGQVIALGLLAFQIWQDERQIIQAEWPTTSDLKSAASRYRRFALYSAPQGALNNISQNIPVYLLSAFFGSTIVGHYGLAQRLLSLPLLLIGRSVRQVVMQRASEIQHKQGDLLNLLQKTTLGLTAISLLPTAFIILWGPQIFQVILGQQWILAGRYSQWMVLWLFSGLIMAPSGSIISVIDRLKMLFVWDIVQLFCTSVMIILGGLFFDDQFSVATFSVVGTCFNLYLIVSVYLYINRRRIHANTS